MCKLLKMYIVKTKQVPAIKIVQCDLRDWDRTREILQTVGDIDLLVNNAGVSRIGPFLDVKEEDIDW
jgi:L-xylulose reductase